MLSTAKAMSSHPTSYCRAFGSMYHLHQGTGNDTLDHRSDPEEPYMFYKNSAPFFMVHVTQESLAKNVHDHVISNILFPGLTPLDSSVWSVAKRDTNQQTHNTKDLLKLNLVDGMANINENLSMNAVTSEAASRPP